jgi:uncharacterized protein
MCGPNKDRRTGTDRGGDDPAPVGAPPVHRSGLARGAFIALGTLFLVLGLIGIVLPVLPTTPFLLLAAAAYARGSSRLYGWLLRNRRFGPVIRAWRESRTIPRRARRNAIVLLVIVLGLSVVLIVEAPALRVVLVLTGVAVAIFLARIPPSD